MVPIETYLGGAQFDPNKHFILKIATLHIRVYLMTGNAHLFVKHYSR